MDLLPWITFGVTLLTSVGGLVVWLTKLGSRVIHVENRMTTVEAKQDSVALDISAIRISLARIETKLEFLHEEKA